LASNNALIFDRWGINVSVFDRALFRHHSTQTSLFLARRLSKYALLPINFILKAESLLYRAELKKACDYSGNLFLGIFDLVYVVERLVADVLHFAYFQVHVGDFGVMCAPIILKVLVDVVHYLRHLFNLTTDGAVFHIENFVDFTF